MPKIRVEQRVGGPGTAAAGVFFGPWPWDILFRGLVCSVTFDVAGGARIPRVGCTQFGSSTPAFECYPANELGAAGNQTSALLSAFPGAASLSNTGDLPRWNIPVPYNWIIPASGRVYIFLDGAQAGDQFGGVTLWLEQGYGPGQEARNKPGKGRSSKNNP